MKNNISVEMRDRRAGKWYWIDRIIYDQYSSFIGVIGLALYNAYASYSYDKQKVFPSQITIAKNLGISIPTLIKYDKILIIYKLIQIENRKGTSNLITLLEARNSSKQKLHKIGTKAGLVLKQVKGGAKAGLVPVLKQVNTNKKKENKKKHNKVTCKQSDTIFGYRDSTMYKECAIKLFKIVGSKRKILKKPSLRDWAKSFKLLHTRDTIKKKDIKKALSWYCKNIGENEYTPDIRTGGGFRDKFDKLQAAMERDAKNIEKGAKQTVYKTNKKKKRRVLG